ncbi:MAG TPA: hypothetical protein VHN99_12390 [Deinococcales bacterium]|nr:hypothetical protein [Deinococcales bacterium]
MIEVLPPEDKNTDQAPTGLAVPVWLPYAGILLLCALALYLIERGHHG